VHLHVADNEQFDGALAEAAGPRPGVGAVAVLAAAGGWFAGSGQRPPLAPAEPLRFSVARMAVDVVRTSAEGLTVSSDGRHIVFVGSRGGERRLFRRALDSDAVEEVQGTERAASPFSSPDGKWIGYLEGTTVKKVAVGGGVPITICSRPQTFGQASATWLEDDTVVVGIAAGADDVAGLYQCRMSGGPATRFVASIRPTAVSRVPGRPRVILAQTGGRADGAIHLVDLDSGRIARLIDGATPHVVPPDLLVFTRGEAIWATHFDIAAGTLSDDAVQVADGLFAVGPRNPLFATSPTGTAAFVSRLDTEGSLVWVDRQGAATPFAIRPDGEIRHPALSPDGRTLALGRTNREGEHVWLVDLERQTMARLTTRMASRRPVWKPDGLSITFQGYGSAAGIFEATVGDQEAPRPILVREPGVGPLFPDAWTPDGRTLALARNEAPRDLMLFSDGKLEPFLDSPANERGAAFSPDGRHMVFVSDETGRDEVYLQPYPGRGRRTTVSTSGGTEPAWSRDGRELFYREASRMIAVSFDPSTGRVGTPRLLFEASESDYRDDAARPAYVVAPDGRFVMIRNTATNGGSIQVVVNFVTEVRRRLEQGGPR
jgi:serine/threonine-protein kinase